MSNIEIVNWKIDYKVDIINLINFAIVIIAEGIVYQTWSISFCVIIQFTKGFMYWTVITAGAVSIQKINNCDVIDENIKSLWQYGDINSNIRAISKCWKIEEGRTGV